MSFDRKAVTRSSCWFVKDDCKCPYKYSKSKTWQPHPFPKWMEEAANFLSDLLGCEIPFNSCNANLYETYNQDLYWHSDDEELFRQSEFQRETCIASVSFGASRKFSVRKKYSSDDKSIELMDGDILSMEGLFQDKFDHIIRKGLVGGSRRVNLTFRVLRRHSKGCPQRKTR